MNDNELPDDEKKDYPINVKMGDADDDPTPDPPATPPEALYILGAAYGKTDITVAIRNMVTSNGITVTANDETFADEWEGTTKKTLVIVYRYGSTADHAKVAHCVQDIQLVISSTSDNTRHEVVQTKGELCIIAAVYGNTDITDIARQNISNDKKRFNRKPVNIFDDTWVNIKKTLVVVSSYGSGTYVDIAEDDKRMRIVNTPLLNILGATFGTGDVTSIVRAQASSRGLSIRNKWGKVELTLVVVYQYEGYLRRTQIAKPKSYINISFINQTVEPPMVENFNYKLHILGAAYGLKDVTLLAKTKTSNNAINNVSVNNDEWGGDSWAGKTKTLTIVYRYGYHAIQIETATEGQAISVFTTLPQTNLRFLHTKGLFHSDDQITVKASFAGLKWATNDNNELTLSENNAITFVVTLSDDDDAIQLKNKTNNYVLYRDANGKLKFDSDGDKADGTNDYFYTKMDQHGQLRFSVLPNRVVSVKLEPDNAEWSINAFNTEQRACVCSLVMFDITFVASPWADTHTSLPADFETTACFVEKALFLWELTAGFLHALGLAPFVSDDETRDIAKGLLKFVMDNNNVNTYIDNLRINAADDDARNHLLQLLFGDPSITKLLVLMYDEGILWCIFKIIFKIENPFSLAWLLGRVVVIIVLPESEGAELMAEFTVWMYNVIEQALHLQACLTSH